MSLRTITTALAILSVFVGAGPRVQAEDAGDPEKDPRMRELLQQARSLIDTKQPVAAIKRCDEVIASYLAFYGKRMEKAYCASNSTQSLAILLEATNKGEDAIVLGSTTWAGAHYMKGFALIEMGKIAEAKPALLKAVEMAPWDAQARNELGQLYLLEKNWSAAQAQFAAAEGRAGIGPDDSKASDLAHARRGLGYVFVELGKLAEAEEKYQQCLATDPKDERAKRELAYVRDLRTKTKR